MERGTERRGRSKGYLIIRGCGSQTPITSVNKGEYLANVSQSRCVHSMYIQKKMMLSDVDNCDMKTTIRLSNRRQQDSHTSVRSVRTGRSAVGVDV
jgi:hypothetical protein